MGGPVVIETIRPGVEFVPEAAAAFRRAEARVRAEFGRGIDVNSTYRDWNTQLRMYNAWQAWITGRGPHPGHSKALHPADPLAFHTKGLALDSDDWRNARIVQILAEHGFIRNRLYVPNEQHHFEYLRDHDKHRHDPAPAGLTEEDDMPLSEEDLDRIAERVWSAKVGSGNNRRTMSQVLTELPTKIATAVWGAEVGRGASRRKMSQVLADIPGRAASAVWGAFFGRDEQRETAGQRLGRAAGPKPQPAPAPDPVEVEPTEDATVTIDTES